MTGCIFHFFLPHMATIVVGGLLLTAAAGGAAAAGAGASAYLYRRKQKKKAKKKKKQKEQIVFGQHLEEVTCLSENDLPKVFDFTVCWLENNGRFFCKCVSGGFSY